MTFGEPTGIALIGSRAASRYGEQVTSTFAGGLVAAVLLAADEEQAAVGEKGRVQGAPRRLVEGALVEDAVIAVAVRVVVIFIGAFIAVGFITVAIMVTGTFGVKRITIFSFNILNI